MCDGERQLRDGYLKAKRVHAMTITERFLIPVLLTASVVASVCNCRAGENVQPASLKQSEREAAERQSALLENKLHEYRYDYGATSYKIVTGKQADYTNLVESLRSPKALESFMTKRVPKGMRGRQGIVRFSEASAVVYVTLTVLVESGRAFPELTNEIVRCYKQSEDWVVRYLCAKVLQQSKAAPDIRMFVRDMSARAGKLKSAVRNTAEGDELDSILCAMARLDIDHHRFPELTDALICCYQANNDWSIKIRCRKVLERYDKDAAERFRREEMFDPECDLSARLSIAKDCLEKGDPGGYPVLREGLLWRSYDGDHYDQAMTLLDGFRVFDGKPFDGSGRRVDIRALLRESAATNELVACQIRNRYLQTTKCSSVAESQSRKDAPEILKHFRYSLWVRIVYAKIFAEDMGWLIGYPILREGLLSRDDYTRKKALELLDLFRRHDGQPYDDENHIIDIHALLREVENAKQGKVAPESRGIEGSPENTK